MGASDLRDQLQTTLGDAYRLERELPGGGMSRVFVAEEARFGRHVVVKLLDPELAGSVSAERFRREIQTLGTLLHPRIVPILAVGEQFELLYYTMPYVEGESLKERLAREKQLPVDEALRITAEVAEALAFAHRHGIIHRDVKPGNVLLAAGSAMVTDFGIARAVERATTRPSFTSSGFTLGTPTYMSPEQAAASEELDGRSDLYSLGCVLYEMLSGEPPFTGPTAQAVIARHIAEPPRSIRLIRREVPEQVEQLVLRLLAKAPADRYATAERVAEVARHPERASTMMEVVPRRWRRGLAAGAALGVVAATSMVALARRPSPAATAGPPAAAADDDPTHLAVLYFDAPPGDARLAAVAGGITRDLIYTLSHVPGLTLTSARGVRDLRDARAAGRPAESADSGLRALHVGTVVDGSIETVGDSLRVEVHVLDARMMVEKDVSRVTVPRTLLVTLRDTVVRLVADRLRRQLGREVQLRTWRAETRSDSAWRLRQESEQLLEQEGALPRAPEHRAPGLALLGRADSLLARVETLDPEWIEPDVARAIVALRTAERSRDDAKTSAGALARARTRTTALLARHPEDARVQELAGRYWYSVSVQGGGEGAAGWDSAAAHLRAAVAADPRQPSAWNTLSIVLQSLGDHAGAVDALRHAIEADAYLRNDGRTTNRMIFSQLFAGQGDSARATCARMRARFPASDFVSACDLSVLGWVGRGHADAAQAWEALRRIERDGPLPRVAGISPEGRFYVAAVLARSGLADSARAVAARTRGALAQAGAPDEASINEAAVHVLLGDRAAALLRLERAVRGSPGAVAQISALPWFTPLRGDPRFERLLGR